MSQKPKTYEQLRKIWYKKLEKSGFTDIEQLDGNLKVWSSRFTRHRTIELSESRQAYYDMATRFLNEYTFTSNLEKIIWEYHIEGIGNRDIVKLLAKARVKKTNRTTVWLMIKRLREAMKNMYMHKDGTE